jgi:hypothetical protein
VQRLIAAEEQREQRGEGHLRTLITQPVPAADQHPGYNDDRDARDPRSQQHADRDSQGRAQAAVARLAASTAPLQALPRAPGEAASQHPA